ncbi:MAG: efflux transporter outer membrane subunit [Dysgonomonas sp.]
MTKKHIYGVVLLGLVVSMGLPSCQVTNPYKTPEINTDNLYRDLNPTDTTTIASVPWREYFTDPYLQALIDEGLQNNFDMKMALTRIKQSEASLSMARAAYFPSVAIAGSAQQSRYASVKGGDVKALDGHTNTFSLMLGLSWELDVWGKLNRESRASYAQYLNSQEAKNLIQTNIVSGIATYYYTLLSLDEQLRVSKEAIELLKETVSTMEQMKDAGLLNGASVEQTKASLYSTEVNIPDLEMSIRQMENSLSLLVGRKGGAITRTTFAEQVIPAEFKFGVPMQMVANRPDVRSAELSFRSAFELTNAAQASFYPTISLGSSSSPIAIGYSSSDLSGFFKPQNLIANLVGGLTQPIFAKKQLTANLKIKKAQQEEALLNFEKTVITAGNEVSDILYTYNSSLKKNSLRTQQVGALKNSVEYTQLLLKAGEANYLEVITAESNLLQAQLGQVSDKLQQLQASVDLYKALGGGIE